MSRFYTRDYFVNTLVPSAARAAKEHGLIQVKWEAHVGSGVWGLNADKDQPRTKRLFALVDASGHVTPGPAYDPAIGGVKNPRKRSTKKPARRKNPTAAQHMEIALALRPGLTSANNALRASVSRAIDPKAWPHDIHDVYRQATRVSRELGAIQEHYKEGSWPEKDNTPGITKKDSVRLEIDEAKSLVNKAASVIEQIGDARKRTNPGARRRKA